jgi:hypothetical protein
MFGNTGIRIAAILLKTQVVRITIVKQKRINIWICGKSIILKF